MEWSSINKYNSFNSDKGLTYYEHYKKIVAWLNGHGKLPPPIEASLDPMNACNHKCYYCNSQRYLRDNPAKLQQWDRRFIQDTLNELAFSGVSAFCWGGGGEALLNKNIRGMTAYGVNLGMQSSIITNGVLLDDELINEMLLCRWIGISLDSARPETYRQIRGTDDCNKVLTNISKLTAKVHNTDIAVKVLVLPENLIDIVYTCKVAKSLGVRDFHVRPVDTERKDYKDARQLGLNMDMIKHVFEQCHKEETNDFHVYTVIHKYDENFHVKHDFKRCLASPLVAQICTDKKQYVCVDHRLETRFEIKEWGSDEHRKLLKGIDPSHECSRCTWSQYNQQIEQCVLEDRLCRNFP